MNELQRKLARRRSLNGESDGSNGNVKGSPTEIKSENNSHQLTDNKKDEDVSSHVNTNGPTGHLSQPMPSSKLRSDFTVGRPSSVDLRNQKFVSNTNSDTNKNNELQNKLLRKKNLNGEPEAVEKEEPSFTVIDTKQEVDINVDFEHLLTEAMARENSEQLHIAKSREQSKDNTEVPLFDAKIQLEEDNHSNGPTVDDCNHDKVVDSQSIVPDTQDENIIQETTPMTHHQDGLITEEASIQNEEQEDTSNDVNSNESTLEKKDEIREEQEESSPIDQSQIDSSRDGSVVVLEVESLQRDEVVEVVDTKPSISAIETENNDSDQNSSSSFSEQSRGILASVVRSPSMATTPTHDTISHRHSTGGSNGWYPGKYLMERRLPWSKSNRILDLNSSQAADLFLADSVITDTTDASNSSKDASVATGEASSMDELRAENEQLRREIEHLRAELDRKQAIIDAYELSVSVNSVSTSNGSSSKANAPQQHSQGSQSPTNDQESMHRHTVNNRRRKLDLAFSSTVNITDDDDDNDTGLFDDIPDEPAANGNTAHKTDSRKGMRITGSIADDLKALEDSNHTDLGDDLGSLDQLLGQNPFAKAKANTSQAKAQSNPLEETEDDDLFTTKTDYNNNRHARYNPLTFGNAQEFARSYANATTQRRVDDGSSNQRNPSMIRQVSDKDNVIFDKYGLLSDDKLSKSSSDVTTTPTSSSSGASKQLFQDTPAAGKASNNNNNNNPSVGSSSLTYQIFMEKFGRCTDLVHTTRRFLFSILGPNGDAKPPQKGSKVDYIFYGKAKMDERCRQFFEQIQEHLPRYAAFAGVTDDELITARDHFEQYVMNSIYHLAFDAETFVEDDKRLELRMKHLSFLTPEVLEIKPELMNETLLQLAADEIRKMDKQRTPAEKVACVVKAVTIIFRSLSMARTKEEASVFGDSAANKSKTKSSGGEQDHGSSPAGADDFLPLFIWVVLHSNAPRLYSNCEYIQNYLNPAHLMSKSGYCLINLRSAIEFVSYVEASSLNIDPQYFDEQLRIAEENYKA